MKEQLVKTGEYLKHRLLRMWSLLPIFALTGKGGCFDSGDGYCLSLVNLLLGEKNLQIGSLAVRIKKSDSACIKDTSYKNDFNTYCMIIAVRWCKVTSLSEQETFNLSEDKCEQLLNRYRAHIADIDAKGREIEKEELLRKLACEQNRIDTSYNKINSFMSIFLAIIPLMTGFMDWYVVLDQKKWQWAVLFVLMYAVLNLSGFLFQSLRVRGVALGSFSDIKNSDDKETEQMVWIYHDWQQVKRKADLFVSFVSFAQEWVVRVIVLFIIYMIVISL